MSTSIKNRTPPRKSKPRFIGLPPTSVNQEGVAGARLSATEYLSPSASAIFSFAGSCCSSLFKRTKIALFSNNVDFGEIFAPAKACST